MLELVRDKNIDAGDLDYLYLSKGYSAYENRMEELHKAVRASDYVITAWEEDRLAGIIRSSGDMKFVQYISDLVIHPDYQSKGVASKLMNDYLENVSDVDEVYLIMDTNPRSFYTKNWLIYNGFKVISDTGSSSIYLRTHKEAE